MCEKKKTTYYYTPETEALIKKGFEMFTSLSPSGTLTLTGLIDICIRKATIEGPEALQRAKEYTQELISENREFKDKLNSYRNAVLETKRLSNLQKSLDSRIQELINLE